MTYIVIVLAVVVILFVLVTISNTKENMKYLTVYDAQDAYKQNPHAYPVRDTDTTSRFNLQRGCSSCR